MEYHKPNKNENWGEYQNRIFYPHWWNKADWWLILGIFIIILGLTIIGGGSLFELEGVGKIIAIIIGLIMCGTGLLPWHHFKDKREKRDAELYKHWKKYN